MRDCGELGTVSRCVVVELEEWDGEELHVFWDGEDFSFRHLHEEKFLAFFRLRDVGRYERVHECFKVGPPPLGEAVADLPVVADPVCAVELLGLFWGREADVEEAFEAVDFVFAWFEVVAGEFEECIGDLKHEDVRVSVVVDYEDALHGSAHAEVFIVVL